MTAVGAGRRLGAWPPSWVTPTTLEEALGLLRALWEENGALRERVEELEARLQQNSTNSSRPPSSDPPETPAPAQRQVLPPEAVDHVARHWPAQCQHCQAPLSAGPAGVVGEPVRHQVTELPPVRAEVTEHRLYRVRCGKCGGETRAA